MTSRGVARARAWLGFVVAVVLLLATQDAAFRTSAFLRARGMLAWSLLFSFAAVATASLYCLVFGCRIRRPAPYLRAAAVLAVAAVAVAAWRTEPADRFHFVEYGLLFAIALRAVTVDVATTSAYAIASLVTAAVGVLDETLQGMSTVRHFDANDVLLDVASAATAALVALALFGREPALVRRAVPPPA